MAYGGGCEPHDFELCWDGVFLDYFIPEVHLTLGHNANADMCDMWVVETVEFDASLIRETYGVSGTVSVIVYAPDGELIGTVYDF